MKFLIIALFGLLSATAGKAQTADDVNVSASVMASFKSSFQNASDVAWKVTDQFSKAEFSLNGQVVTAFYDANASLMAVTRNVSPTQLPVLLQKKLRTSYQAFWISDLFELSDENGTVYYATVEDGEQKVTLKSTSGNDWSVFKRQCKS